MFSVFFLPQKNGKNPWSHHQAAVKGPSPYAKVDPYSANAMQSRPSAGPVPTPLQTQPVRPPNSMARPVAANGVPLPAGSGVTQMEMPQGVGGDEVYPFSPNQQKNDMSPEKGLLFKKEKIVFQSIIFF